MLGLIAIAIAFVATIFIPFPPTIKVIICCILSVFFIVKLIGDYLVDIIHNRNQNKTINLLQAQFPNAEIFLFTKIGSNPEYTHHPSKEEPTNEYVFASTEKTPIAKDDNDVDTIKATVNPIMLAIIRIQEKRTLNQDYPRTLAYVKNGEIQTQAIA